MSTPVALITGAARRVGRSVALHLAGRGYDIAFTYHTAGAEARTLVDELTALGVGCCPIQVNLLDLPAAVAAIADRLTAFRPSPRLDALIHNASLYQPDDPANPHQPADLWRLHAEAPLLLTRRLAPLLCESHGCVITLCDLLAERPMPGYLAYCASKAALANLTLGLARELAPQARVCGIAPGVVEWPANFPEPQKQTYLQRVPLGRSGTPEDVAKLVHYLLTDGAYLTGQIIRLDGGRSIV
jgi:pteridine reductase